MRQYHSISHRARCARGDAARVVHCPGWCSSHDTQLASARAKVHFTAPLPRRRKLEGHMRSTPAQETQRRPTRCDTGRRSRRGPVRAPGRRRHGAIGTGGAVSAQPGCGWCHQADSGTSMTASRALLSGTGTRWPPDRRLGASKRVDAELVQHVPAELYSQKIPILASNTNVPARSTTKSGRGKRITSAPRIRLLEGTAYAREHMLPSNESILEKDLGTRRSAPGRSGSSRKPTRAARSSCFFVERHRRAGVQHAIRSIARTVRLDESIDARPRAPKALGVKVNDADSGRQGPDAHGNRASERRALAETFRKTQPGDEHPVQQMVGAAEAGSARESARRPATLARASGHQGVRADSRAPPLF